MWKTSLYNKNKHSKIMHLWFSDVNSFLASSNFCGLLMTFANRLDLVQDGQFVSPDLDPSCLTLMLFLKEFFESFNFEKISKRQNKHEKLLSM